MDKILNYRWNMLFIQICIFFIELYSSWVSKYWKVFKEFFIIYHNKGGFHINKIKQILLKRKWKLNHLIKFYSKKNLEFCKNIMK